MAGKTGIPPKKEMYSVLQLKNTGALKIKSVRTNERTGLSWTAPPGGVWVGVWFSSRLYYPFGKGPGQHIIRCLKNKKCENERPAEPGDLKNKMGMNWTEIVFGALKIKSVATNDVLCRFYFDYMYMRLPLIPWSIAGVPSSRALPYHCTSTCVRS